MQGSRSKTMRSRDLTTVSVALFAVIVVALAYAQQESAKPAGGTKATPPKSEWSDMDCLTSGCHVGLSKKKFVHTPVTQGACEICHAVSDEATHEFEFEEEMPDQCLQCHDAVAEAIDEDGDSISRHFPASMGDCGSCHDPHASDIAGLLVASYPAKKYVRFEEEAYELCFMCHEVSAMTEARVDDETEFRNGAVNLHYLHVAKNAKGRTCAMCHESHAAEQAKLVRKSVRFNKWEMPIDYRATDTGGYCGPSCHAAKRYDREAPVDWTVRPEPPR